MATRIDPESTKRHEIKPRTISQSTSSGGTISVSFRIYAVAKGNPLYKDKVLGIEIPKDAANEVSRRSIKCGGSEDDLRAPMNVVSDSQGQRGEESLRRKEVISNIKCRAALAQEDEAMVRLL